MWVNGEAKERDERSGKITLQKDETGNTVAKCQWVSSAASPRWGGVPLVSVICKVDSSWKIGSLSQMHVYRGL